MTQSPQFLAFQERWHRAVDAGLIAASYVFMNEVKRRLAQGYTTGHWKTGNVVNSVTRTEPMTLGGVRLIKVGTNVKYAAFWEFGFRQRLIVWFDERKGRWYSRPGPTRFMRVEHWREALEAAQDDMRRAFATEFDRVLRAG